MDSFAICEQIVEKRDWEQNSVHSGLALRVLQGNFQQCNSFHCFLVLQKEVAQPQCSTLRFAPQPKRIWGGSKYLPCWFQSSLHDELGYTFPKQPIANVPQSTHSADAGGGQQQKGPVCKQPWEIPGFSTAGHLSTSMVLIKIWVYVIRTQIALLSSWLNRIIILGRTMLSEPGKCCVNPTLITFLPHLCAFVDVISHFSVHSSSAR